MARGAPSGITTVDLQWAIRLPRATPWAWFPAEAAMIPLAFCSSLRVMMQLEAPRTLKDPVRWRFSSFRNTSRSLMVLKVWLCSSGVLWTSFSSRSWAARMVSRVMVVSVMGISPFLGIGYGKI